MSGRVGDRKRLVCVSAANLREHHLYLTGHTDFFPADAFGPSTAKAGIAKPVRLDVAGLTEPVFTDIPTDARTGKPRTFFRKRAWVGEFFARHGIKPGDTIAIERIGTRRFRVLPFDAKSEHQRLKIRDGRTARRFAEFFAGIGLVRMGLEAEGWNLAYANDIDPEKLAMYQAHFGDADEHFHLGDVHSIDGSRLPDVELATASFPCTDLSIAGARLGFKGEHSSAFWGFISAIRGMHSRRPPLVMLENVVGFLTSHGGADFRAAMEALNELGYAIDSFVLDARWFVPQSRPRLFVVGSMIPNGDAMESAPVSRIRPMLLRKFIADHPGIRWQLRDLPNPPERSERLLPDILENLPDDAPEWWSRDRAVYLYNQFSERHRTTADAMIAKRRWSYATVFRRVRMQPNGEKRSMGELRTDGIAGCLRTPKGGSGRQILFKAGYGRYAARLLTPRECARLMGADEFNIGVPDNQAFFGFGDAVCVPAISWIAEHYLNPALASVRPGLSRATVVGA